MQWGLKSGSLVWRARRGKLGKREWQKRREARDKAGPVVCLCEYKGPPEIPCDKVPSPKCVHTKCVAAAKEKAKHAQAEEEQRKKEQAIERERKKEERLKEKLSPEEIEERRKKSKARK